MKATSAARSSRATASASTRGSKTTSGRSTAGKTPAGRTRSSSVHSTPQRRPAATKTAQPILAGISPERKLDLVGIGLALVGLLTLLSLLSTAQGSLTGAWGGFLSRAFGWGVYFLPLALIAIGVWLVLRNVDRLPHLAAERLVGIGLLYFALLGIVHLAAGGDQALAEAGKGGGSIGWLIARLLRSGLGLAGAWIALLAWLLIALAMSLDLSVREIFHWILPLTAWLKTTWERLNAPREVETYSPAHEIAPANEAYQDDYTPFQHYEDEPAAELPVQTRTNPPAPASSTPTTAQPAASNLPEAAHATAWALPVLENILDASGPSAGNGEADQDRAHLIEETLRSFGAPGHVVEIHRGPTITQFGLEPDFVETRAGRTRVRVSKIVSLADDLALALAAPRIRIQAPVPGRAYVGIEVPNTEVTRVGMLDILQSETFKKVRSPLRFTLGKDVAGKPVVADLTAMPHLLIAGTTGSGKSVCVNSILCSLLLNNTPDDVRLVLVDPKRVELTGYNGIPHLLAPVVVDVEKVTNALQWMMREMDSRYREFSRDGARNIVDYNNKRQSRGEKKIPYLVVVIDELADLMMLAPDETERTITRLAQLARATGLHLILATQRPSVDVLTGLIKANFPARIAFAVASGVDSRVILDQPGAERLLGRGDMLFQAPDAPAPVRLQGVFVSDTEIQRAVTFWKEQVSLNEAPEQTGASASSAGAGPTPLAGTAPLKQAALWDDLEPAQDEDPMLKESIELVRREGRASISMLQRRLRVGYTRAARLIDSMEEKGIIGPSQANSQVRPVLDYGSTAPPSEEE